MSLCISLARKHWTDIQDELIAEIDADYGVFDGRTFKEDRFEAYLERNDIPWPRLESGRLDLDDSKRHVFREMAKIYPVISPLRELRHALSTMRLFSDLTIGEDGRNRAILSAFGSITGRNQPSNAKFIFGTSTWIRGFIKPPPGHGIAYIDWSSQEVGIAAALVWRQEHDGRFRCRRSVYPVRDSRRACYRRALQRHRQRNLIPACAT